MSAETLRRAATLMRERAEAATGDWHPRDDWFAVHEVRAALRAVDSTTDADADAAHIASWHPAVALAVADWLDSYANRLETLGHGIGSNMGEAVAVALVYLGESA